MFLQSMINQKLAAEKISLRQAAAQIGMAHSTLRNFLIGNQMDMDTIQKICNWLNVSVRDALGFDTDSDTAAAVATVLEMEPELAEIFRAAATDVRDGKLPPEDFLEIVRYATYRLQTAKKEHQVTEHG